MIRINLLSLEKAAPKRSLSFKVGQQGAALASAAIVAAGFVYIGLHVVSQHREGSRLDGELAVARAEKARLQPILQQVARFEARKKDLQRRVELIEELRRNQGGPVQLLDQISRSLPDRLWLIAMKQTGDDVQLDGRTSSLTALADFVGNLENSGYFKRPVEILGSEEEKDNENDLIRFSIKATFSMPGVKAAPAASRAGPMTPGGPARAAKRAR
jgi:type IV pilus assembly protein PilN